MAVSAGAVRCREALPPVALGATGTSVTLRGHPEDPSSPAVRAAPRRSAAPGGDRRCAEHAPAPAAPSSLASNEVPCPARGRRPALPPPDPPPRPVSRGRGRSPAARVHAVAPSQLPARLSRTEAPAG